ncbi:MAG: hypothetical protein KJ077_10715 [Anaerolineae bacterium]|nr:hypothetical protein [Anaerolineae bacterium]
MSNDMTITVQVNKNLEDRILEFFGITEFGTVNITGEGESVIIEMNELNGWKDDESEKLAAEKIPHIIIWSSDNGQSAVAFDGANSAEVEMVNGDPVVKVRADGFDPADLANVEKYHAICKRLEKQWNPGQSLQVTEQILVRAVQDIADMGAEAFFVPSYCTPETLDKRREEAVGMAISKWTEWDTDAIIRIFHAALVDANCPEADEVAKLLETE